MNYVDGYGVTGHYYSQCRVLLRNLEGCLDMKSIKNVKQENHFLHADCLRRNRTVAVLLALLP